MSVFTSRNTTTIPIPGADAQTAVIRQLAPRHLEAARKESQRKSLATFKEYGAALFKELREVSPEDIAKETARDPLMGYDQETLVLKGVVSWTLDQDLSAETCADLHEDTLEGLARAILQCSKPGLFRSDEETEAARKNG